MAVSGKLLQVEAAERQVGAANGLAVLIHRNDLQKLSLIHIFLWKPMIFTVNGIHRGKIARVGSAFCKILPEIPSVSYTHLDVYKRQGHRGTGNQAL